VIKNKPKVIVILGQTATGKSALAVKIAKKVGGEVISADSRQVYKALDLGTGKVPRDKMSIPGLDSPNRVWTFRGIPHHLLDVANPKRKFTVAQYKKLADQKIKEIISRGKVPIICGGTGFYIDAVVKNITFPEVPPNNKLRKALIQKSATALFYELQKLDPERAKNIDKNNKVRLIRAIEIAKKLGKVPQLQKLQSATNSARAEGVASYEFIKIGLHLPTEKLKERIEKRLLKRIKVGMVKEAERLHKSGLSWKRMEELGLEYRSMALYLQNKITKEEMVKRLNSEIYKYAKRQMTWFKRDKEIKWLTPSEIEGLDASEMVDIQLPYRI
jgi:tRNA dimethylallyltransferase